MSTTTLLGEGGRHKNILVTEGKSQNSKIFTSWGGLYLDMCIACIARVLYCTSEMLNGYYVNTGKAR